MNEIVSNFSLYYRDIETDFARLNQSLGSLPWQLEQIAEHVRTKLTLAEPEVSAGHGTHMYTPLSPHNASEIRALELLPGSFDDPIHSILHHCTLDFEYPELASTNPLDTTAFLPRSDLGFHPETKHALSTRNGEPLFYTAISYCWGLNVFNCPVTCNGVVKTVTATLDAALRHFRHESEPIMLWIDQLCINQADADEKARQVPLMALVYQRALNTVIWLGPEPDNGAFVLLRAIDDNLLEFSQQEQSSSVFEQFTGDRMPKGFDVDGAWEALKSLFERWWFSRTWIIQEAVLSGHTMVRCGRDSGLWDDVTAGAMAAMDSGFWRWLEGRAGVSATATTTSDEQLSARAGCEIASELGSQKTQLKGMGEMRLPLTVALVDCRYAACSELRDKVYGVLGLVNAKMTPDYRKPIADVYREAALLSIVQIASNREEVGTAWHYHHNFRLLACIDHGPGTPLPDGSVLPSWVPDWSRPRVTTSLGFSYSSLVTCNAGNWDAKGVFSLSEDKLVVRTPGMIFAQLQTSADPFELLAVDSDDEFRHVRLAFQFVESKCPYPNADDAVEIFTQLCVAGRDETGKQKSPDEFRTQMSKILAYAKSLDSRQGQVEETVSAPSVKNRKGKTQAIISLQRSSPKWNKWYDSLRDLRTASSNALGNRVLRVLSNGYLALAPSIARQGDFIAVLAGAGLPYVLRKIEGRDHAYQLIGECYVHGIMQGEIVGMSFEEIVIGLV